ncbi:hypothetical protein [Actinophytocola sp.]|uniref:hypothetical protein n=1 Tax=Actinophytocola sp. TaxID=1872138 RepID=UPI0039C887BB
MAIHQIAAAAGVSPALVVHHFGGEEGLRRAVHERVLAIFDDLFDIIGDRIGRPARRGTPAPPHAFGRSDRNRSRRAWRCESVWRSSSPFTMSSTRASEKSPRDGRLLKRRRSSAATGTARRARPSRP